jgi:predicted extracellular nuclease
VKVTGNKGKVKAPKKKDQIEAIELTDYSNLEQYEGMRVRVTNKAVTETFNSGRYNSECLCIYDIQCIHINISTIHNLP